MRLFALPSPLGLIYRFFALTTLLCAISCWRAVTWLTEPPDDKIIRYTALQITLESGRVCWMRYEVWPHAMLDCNLPVKHPPSGITFGIPEPVGYRDGLLSGMMIPKTNERVIRRGNLYYRTAIPLWPLTLMTLLPAMRFAGHQYHRRITARRQRRGCCTNCGYDLRASPGRCPECGRAPIFSPAFMPENLRIATEHPSQM